MCTEKTPDALRSKGSISLSPGMGWDHSPAAVAAVLAPWSNLNFLLALPKEGVRPVPLDASAGSVTSPSSLPSSPPALSALGRRGPSPSWWGVWLGDFSWAGAVSLQVWMLDMFKTVLKACIHFFFFKSLPIKLHPPLTRWPLGKWLKSSVANFVSLLVKWKYYQLSLKWWWCLILKLHVKRS